MFAPAMWTAIGAVAAGVGGLAAGVSSIVNQPKAPKSEPLPQAPTVESAEETAKKNLEAKRRRMLMAGGETDLTGGSSNILGTGSRRTLLS
jgi:hypothetical protein